jgi:hypothetical protein
LTTGKSRVTAGKTIGELDNLIGFTRKQNDIPFDEVVQWNERLDEIRGTPDAFATTLQIRRK